MKSPSKHRSIASQLATEILAGKYRQTGRLPSEVQLLQRFGVSRPTIGQALLVHRELHATASSVAA